jgi:hypothetical protein
MTGFDPLPGPSALLVFQHLPARKVRFRRRHQAHDREGSSGAGKCTGQLSKSLHAWLFWLVLGRGHGCLRPFELKVGVGRFTQLAAWWGTTTGTTPPLGGQFARQAPRMEGFLTFL